MPLAINVVVRVLVKLHHFVFVEGFNFKLNEWLKKQETLTVHPMWCTFSIRALSLFDEQSVHTPREMKMKKDWINHHKTHFFSKIIRKNWTNPVCFLLDEVLFTFSRFYHFISMEYFYSKNPFSFSRFMQQFYFLTLLGWTILIKYSK